MFMTPHDYYYHHLANIKAQEESELDDTKDKKKGCLVKMLECMPCITIKYRDNGSINFLEMFTINH
jgi:hypothetical protein